MVAPKLEFEQSDLVPTQLKSQFIDAIDKIIHEVSPKLSDSTWKNYDYMGIVIPAIYCGVMKSLWLILMILVWEVQFKIFDVIMAQSKISLYS